jgi:hypothetical protein
LYLQQLRKTRHWHENCTSADIVTARVVLVGIGFVVLLAIPALADLPCQPASLPPVPLTVGAFLDQLLGSVLQNGIAVLFVAALAVVGLPWMMAGLAMALVQLPRRKS